MTKKYAKDQPTGFSNCIEKVAVVGASGQIGKHVTEQLLKAGKHIVTAIARSTSTYKLPEVVQVTHVDYSDSTTLVEALRDQQVLSMSRCSLPCMS
ncbi:uncharacterized protein ATNIH1004_009193 [Aspergillus tanneri]|uniref:NAD(P)-binding domain-containing protein n=1 Tax=Aspergillus tanneri TaxID=1220188 RepID=A0A5M9MDB7_9EURO|nr:uncharacterized protein ATNIH1004_009193 [Aspergillus tanneri]KAA8644982.1 hypothetical protein ATNIH1004_009193 [Aspergillus tanneri]